MVFKTNDACGPVVGSDAVNVEIRWWISLGYQVKHLDWLRSLTSFGMTIAPVFQSGTPNKVQEIA